LTIAVIAGLVSRVIAVTVGMVAGYLGGKSDRVLMFVSDGLLVIPLFLMIIMLAMLIRDSMNVTQPGPAAGDLRLGLGCTADSLADSELARARIYQDRRALRHRHPAAGDSTSTCRTPPR
jgi:ABC-type dipeptide/oligopeptide/nickel transport system permease subunit